MLTLKEQEERLELYYRGLTDDEIAEALGMKKKGVAEWRRRLGLKANRTSIHDLHTRMELYNQGLTDKEIAEKLYYSPNTISLWRRRLGLPPNKKFIHRETCQSRRDSTPHAVCCDCRHYTAVWHVITPGATILAGWRCLCSLEAPQEDNGKEICPLFKSIHKGR